MMGLLGVRGGIECGQAATVKRFWNGDLLVGRSFLATGDATDDDHGRVFGERAPDFL
jgi:hypothetical protein